MGGSAKGWSLRLDPRTSTWTVRFTVAGKRYHRSTHERDRGEAAKVAQRLYAAAVIGGPKAKSYGVGREPLSMSKATAAWLDDMRSYLDERTVHSYELYASAQWIGRWKDVDAIDTASAADYTRDRLSEVLRRTHVKELSALRSFLRWLKQQKHIDTVPTVEQPPRRAIGTPDADRYRKRQVVELDSSEIEAIIAELPEWSTGGPGGPPFRVRARFILAWETSLRPETISSLRAPEDYRKGAKVLTIREEADKARNGRPLELSKRAREVLESLCPDEGYIFGHHDCRYYLRDAAKEAVRKKKLSAAKAEKVTAYDFRHGRITHLAEVAQGDIPTIMALAGHKHASTTSKYIRAVAVRTQGVLERAAQVAAAPAPLLATVPDTEIHKRKSKRAKSRKTLQNKPSAREGSRIPTGFPNGT